MQELNVVSVVTSLSKKVIEVLSQHKLHVKVFEHTEKIDCIRFR